MTTLLAAIDDSPACRPILEFARQIATPMDADLVALHVPHDDSGDTARAIARRLDVPLVIRDGDIVTEILAARDELHAVALVVGTRSVPGGTTTAGHVTLALARESSVPLVVVPPETANRPIERILVALEHDGDSDVILKVAEQLGPATPHDIVAIHVFRPEDIPPYADDPVFEAELRRNEFLRSMTGPGAARTQLEVRVGDPAVQVSAAVHELNADLVVLAWKRDLSANRAAIVRRVLETAPVPVVLLDVQPVAAGAEI